MRVDRDDNFARVVASRCDEGPANRDEGVTKDAESVTEL